MFEPEVDLDTLIVMRYELFYKLLRKAAEGEDIDELIDELLNVSVSFDTDATPEP